MSQKLILNQILAGYQQFNNWEIAEQQQILPQLTIEASLRQYFELCALVNSCAPNAKQEFLPHQKQHWIAMRYKYQKLLKGMSHASPTPRLERS